MEEKKETKRNELSLGRLIDQKLTALFYDRVSDSSTEITGLTFIFEKDEIDVTLSKQGKIIIRHKISKE